MVIFCLQCSLQDVFRNESVSYDVEAVELACDGVIMDMAYCPTRLVISATYCYTSIMFAKMLYAIQQKVSLSFVVEIWRL